MSTEEQRIDETNISESRDHNDEQDEEELRLLLLPDVSTLPQTPPSAVQSNFVSYFALDFMKPGHDQYVYRHANGYNSNFVVSFLQHWALHYHYGCNYCIFFLSFFYCDLKACV